MATPMIVDGLALSDQTDFAALAREALLGGGGLGGLPNDVLPLDAVDRLHADLAGTPYADRLSRGIAASLDAEPFVRYQALLFFEKHPQAAGAERIDDIVAGDRSLFEGVVETTANADLGFGLLRALGARALAADGRARDLARREALAAGRALGVIAFITRADPDWAEANAEAIVRGTPGALGPLLFQLQLLERDIVPVGERLARLVPVPELRAVLERVVSDGEVRLRILAAVP